MASLEVTDSCFIDNDSNAQAVIALSQDSALLKNEGNYFGGNKVAKAMNTGYRCDAIVWKQTIGWQQYPDHCIGGTESRCSLEL